MPDRAPAAFEPIPILPGHVRVARGRDNSSRLEYRVGEGMWADTDGIASDVTGRLRMVLPPLD